MKKIYYNAKVITMEGFPGLQEAFLVEDGSFKAVGSNDEILALKDADTEVEDMQGKTITPAFFETHMHFLSEGLILRDMNHNECYSIQELIDYSRNFLETHNIPEGRWVRGRGWNQDKFSDEKRFINRYDLDKISTTVPLAFTRTCGHVIVVNTAALKIMGMDEYAEDVEGGVIDRDENGKPLGIFRENARTCVLSAIPEETLEGVKELIMACSKKAVEYGVVEIHSDDFKDVPGNYPKVLQAYHELIESGEALIRSYEQCNLPRMDWLDSFIADGYKTGWSESEYFTVGPYKVLIDGALGAKTALMRDGYIDMDPSYKGVNMLDQETLDALVDKAYKNNFNVAIHAIGDKGIDMVIEAIEKARKTTPNPVGRDGIIHCQIMDEDQYTKFKEMDLIGFIQPIFLNYDYQIIENRVGAEKAKTSYNWKQFFDMGIHACGGSDCPVEDFNIFQNIYCAMTRKSLDGKPEGGWRPEQNLTLEQAMRLFTTEAAYASRREDWAGSIKTGKSADFVVINEDLLNLPADDIKDIKVRRTYMRGKCLYEAE